MNQVFSRPEVDKLLRGVLPVVQTPFADDGTIDTPTLHREIDWVFEAGANGVVVAMVSEILRMDHHQRKELVESVCGAGKDRGSIVISVGAETKDEAVAFAQHAERLGANAVMAIPPVKKPLGKSDTFDYFVAIAESVSVPLIVQDASSYVGSAIDLTVYLQLLERFSADCIFFKPEASPLGPNLSKLRDATHGEARVFEGSGGINLVDCFHRGIVGTMPAADLLDGIVVLWKALEAGNEDRIYELSPLICAIVALQIQGGLDGFLAIEKYLLKKRGIFANTLQIQPVDWELDFETAAEVDRLFARLQTALS